MGQRVVIVVVVFFCAADEVTVIAQPGPVIHLATADALSRRYFLVLGDGDFVSSAHSTRRYLKSKEEKKKKRILPIQSIHVSLEQNLSEDRR